jgi:acetyltransferase
MPQLKALDAATARHYLPQLTDLLIDSVNNGASVGFLAPLSRAEAEAYWQAVVLDLENQQRVLLIALANATTAPAVVGSAQLILENRANGLHRAEVSRVLTHSSARRQGIGRALMLQLEVQARLRQRSLLLLDTIVESPGAVLYESLDYCLAGVIPSYALSSTGVLEPTALYYKLI